MKRKAKRRRKGFTLTEMLCTVLIMSLVVSSAVTGMVALSNSYKKVLRTSNAEEMCNVITTAMTGELSYAKYIETDTNQNLTSFYSATYRTCNYVLEDGRLKVHTDIDKKTNDVIASKTYADGLIIKDMSIKYDASSMMFTVKIHISDTNNADITDTEFKVKSLNM